MSSTQLLLVQPRSAHAYTGSAPVVSSYDGALDVIVTETTDN